MSLIFMVDKKSKMHSKNSTLRPVSLINLLFVTALGAGKVPWAPGTFGSLITLPLVIIISITINYFSNSSAVNLDSWAMPPAPTTTLPLITQICSYLSNPYLPDILLIIVFFITILGIIASNYYCTRTNQHDPKEVVIDEVAGQMLTIAGILLWHNYYLPLKQAIKINEKPGQGIELVVIFLVVPFILFRLFDIWKPWPINYIDQKVQNGLGIMLDDLLAAIYAIATFAVISSIFINS